MTSDDEVRAVAARTARTSYGRILALVAASTRDVTAAEDALADAFERALRTWPDTGIPVNPEGWILTVARNRLRDLFRSAAHRTGAPLDDALEATLADESAVDGSDALERRDAIPDRRLELLFACAHPAIDPAVRTPLMLQTVLGFESAEVARVFDVEPATMAQRLVRAKRRLRGAGIPFAVPTRADMPAACPPCSKRCTARTRSTSSTRATTSAGRSPTRRGGWRCSPRRCWTTSRRPGASPHC